MSNAVEMLLYFVSNALHCVELISSRYRFVAFSNAVVRSEDSHSPPSSEVVSGCSPYLYAVLM